MTPEQKEWIKAQESLITIRPARKPRPPSDLTRRSIYWLVLSPTFEKAILGAIVVNTIALAAPYQGMPLAYSSGLEELNNGLAALFTLESELVCNQDARPPPHPPPAPSPSTLRSAHLCRSDCENIRVRRSLVFFRPVEPL